MNRDIWFEVSRHLGLMDWLQFIRTCKLFNTIKRSLSEMINQDGRLAEGLEMLIVSRGDPNSRYYDPHYIDEQAIKRISHHVIFDYALENGLLPISSLEDVYYLKYINISFIIKYQSHFKKTDWEYFYQRGYLKYNETKDSLREIWNGHLLYLNPTSKTKLRYIEGSLAKSLLIKHGNLAYEDFDVRNMSARDLWKFENIIHRFDWEEVKQDLDILGYANASKSRLTIKVIKEVGIKKWSWVYLTQNPCFTKYDILGNPNLPWRYDHILRNPNIKPEDLLEFPNLPTIITKLRSYVITNIEVIDVLPSCVKFWDWSFISRNFMFHKIGYRDWFWCHIHLPWSKECLRQNYEYKKNSRLREFVDF